MLRIPAIALFSFSISFSAAASAADVSNTPIAVSVWTGFYAGLNAGAAFDNSSVNLTPGGGFLLPPYSATNNLRIFDLGHHNSDFIFGGQIGYNRQFGDDFVLGLETDFNRGPHSNNNAFNIHLPTPLVGNAYGRTATDVEMFGSVRAKAGYAFDRLLLYGTGGLAYGQVKTSSDLTFSSAGDHYAGSETNWKAGWAIGAGAEYKITPSVSVSGEYLHVDLGKSKTDATSSAVGFPTINYTYHSTNKFDLLRVGLNYHF